MPSISTIEIIEDDPQIREQYVTVLTRRGFTVTAARNATEGGRLLADTNPDLILLDILMPGPDGVAFLKAADLSHEHPNTRVIVLSNVETPEYQRDLADLGVTRYLIKADYTPDQIADLIASLG